VEVYLGAVEPHPGALGADPGFMEAYYKTDTKDSMWTYRTSILSYQKPKKIMTYNKFVLL
jgi:hypothetical protein